jgi:hypothetical protein
MSRWRKRRCVWRTTWTLICVSWIKYMSHTEYATKMIMNISDSLHCWSAQRRLAREGACEERLERLCTWVKSLVSYSTCDRDEMIIHLAIAYTVSQRNTFAVHRREVNEIATRVDHPLATHIAQRRSTMERMRVAMSFVISTWAIRDLSVRLSNCWRWKGTNWIMRCWSTKRIKYVI